MCAGSDREWSGFKCFKMGNSPIEHRHDIVVGSKSHGTKDGGGRLGVVSLHELEQQGFFSKWPLCRPLHRALV